MSHKPTTHGPWVTSEILDNGQVGIISAVTNEIIIGVPNRLKIGDLHLIAAAPDLLEALKDTLDFLDRPDITTYEWYKLVPEHLGKFRRAIAKAEGRA